MEEADKPIKAKPTFYAYTFYGLKEIALNHGYNLCMHGSLNRDLDLVAIPWQDEVSDPDDMINEFLEYLDGRIIMRGTAEDRKMYGESPQGRKSYLIDLRRTESTKWAKWVDAEYYIDISVTPGTNVRPKVSEETNE